jgi:hypothetical protein
VGLDVADDLLPGLDQQPYAEQVGQRSGGAVQAGLVPEQGGHAALQGVDARVLPVHVVADLGRQHRLPHRLGRPGDGVGAEVDQPVRARHVAQSPTGW